MPAEGGTDTENEEDKNQGTKVASGQVVGIVNCVNAHHQNRRSDNLREELTSLGEERLRVGAENASSRSGTANGTDTMALKVVDGTLVVSVNNESSNESTEHLTKNVERELLPGESTENAVSESDSRVQVTTRDTTRGVDTEHDTDTPRPIDGLEITLSTSRKDNLGDDTITEQQQNHGTHELGEGLTESVSHAGPKGQVAATLARVDERVVAHIIIIFFFEG